MRITTYLNTTQKEVENKTHNIWIGISLGNKYFTKEHIAEYIRWAIENTKEKVLVVICDALHTINIEVLDKRSPEASFQKAIKIGDQKYVEVQSIISDLPDNYKSKINLVRWKDILDSENYKNNLKIITEEFKQNSEFHNYITEIVKQGRPDRVETISKLSIQRLDRLAEYILNELPLLINGVQGYGDNTIYTLLPYPSISKLDELCIELSNKTIFSGLANKLNLTNKIAILEAYAE